MYMRIIGIVACGFLSIAGMQPKRSSRPQFQRSPVTVEAIPAFFKRQSEEQYKNLVLSLMAKKISARDYLHTRANEFYQLALNNKQAENLVRALPTITRRWNELKKEHPFFIPYTCNFLSTGNRKVAMQKYLFDTFNTNNRSFVENIDHIYNEIEKKKYNPHSLAIHLISDLQQHVIGDLNGDVLQGKFEPVLQYNRKLFSHRNATILLKALTRSVLSTISLGHPFMAEWAMTYKILPPEGNHFFTASNIKADMEGSGDCIEHAKENMIARTVLYEDELQQSKIQINNQNAVVVDTGERYVFGMEMYHLLFWEQQLMQSVANIGAKITKLT